MGASKFEGVEVWGCRNFMAFSGASKFGGVEVWGRGCFWGVEVWGRRSLGASKFGGVEVWGRRSLYQYHQKPRAQA